MKNPVIRVICFVILLAIMITMTFSISGQLFKFGAMVIASFTATEAQEKEANDKIVRYADLMIDGILGETASVFGTSKENEVAFDKLKTQLKELNRLDNKGYLTTVWYDDIPNDDCKEIKLSNYGNRQLFNIEYMEYINNICTLNESLYIYCYI